jgi:hypothetical protein
VRALGWYAVLVVTIPVAAVIVVVGELTDKVVSMVRKTKLLVFLLILAQLSACDLLNQSAQVTCVAGLVDAAVAEVAVVEAKVAAKLPILPKDIDAIVELRDGVKNKNLCERVGG